MYRLATIATYLFVVMALVLGVAAMPLGAADHLDGPMVMTDGLFDINDVYAFRGSKANRTVLAMTVNPAINVLGPTTFQAGAAYTLNFDTGTDAIADTRITTTFGDPDAPQSGHTGNVFIHLLVVAYDSPSEIGFDSTWRNGIHRNVSATQFPGHISR